MTDLELTEICAKWLEIKAETREVFGMLGTGKVWIYNNDKWQIFDPLHNWHDLMTKVVPRLPKFNQKIRLEIIPQDNYFEIHGPFPHPHGKYPDDLPRAILELVAEIEKEGEDGQD